MHNSTTYRFTIADEAAIREALKAAMVKAIETDDPSFPLMSIGAAAVNCTLADLRDVEIDWMGQVVAVLAVDLEGGAE